jgi:carbonic anhydrase
MNNKEIVDLLKEGNMRFANGSSIHPNQTAEYRARLVKSQNPFALIITCNDSRITPEIIFDQGLGDLSVIRVGGNVISDQVLGTIEYVIEHLGVTLIVVMGHERCGAVSVAASGGEPRAHMVHVINEILPAVELAKTMEGDLIHNAVVLNSKLTAEKIRNAKPFINRIVQSGGVQVLSAVYDVHTGVVTFIEV